MSEDFDDAATWLGPPDIGTHKKRRAPIHPESALAKGVARAVKRAVACDHEFAAHDRSGEFTPGAHIWEAQRGRRRHWPDTELVCAGNLTFNCELKPPGWKPPNPHTVAFQAWDGQLRMIGRLIALGRRAAWANSVLTYLEQAELAGVPLNPNWRTVAQHEDELVAADIRRQVEKRDGSVKKSRPFKERATPGRIRAVARARARTMF